MKAIAAHLRYISNICGRLEIAGRRGATMRDKDTLRDLADEWRLGDSPIPDDAEAGHRGEVFKFLLSMPRGTNPLTVRRATREFAQAEFADYKIVMVLHDHQANPYVQVSARGAQARPAPEPAEGRSTPGARDLCREAEWARHRGRSNAVGRPW